MGFALTPYIGISAKQLAVFLASSIFFVVGRWRGLAHARAQSALRTAQPSRATLHALSLTHTRQQNAGVATILTCIVASLKEYLRRKELARNERNQERQEAAKKVKRVKAG